MPGILFFRISDGALYISSSGSACEAGRATAQMAYHDVGIVGAGSRFFQQKLWPRIESKNRGNG
jgi:hypothetical protein